ncbi:MAG: SRPBCC family protein [Gammaproteobacteria bacterium]|nr:SRPBCC family protein [Gammaproteobacteria bacterium]MBU1725295.1 SRPBCC family protein [Gammaproteobacteria bacterium]MBU2006799.1 SRPBCC family protein [Gammaproteobacteria bacterium]
MMWIFLALAAVLLLLPFLVGFMLSPRQQVTRVELVKAATQEVWEALSNLQVQVQWRTGINSVQMLDDDEGLRWVEKPEHGRPVTIRKLKENPPQELLLEMRQGSTNGTRQIRLNAVPGGTRVTFTEMQETRNPLARLACRRQGGLDHKLDRFIHELKNHFAV